MFQKDLFLEDYRKLTARLSELKISLNNLASEGAFASPEVVTATRFEFGLIQLRLSGIPEELEQFREIPVAADDPTWKI
jgi:hypothetical protein